MKVLIGTQNPGKIQGAKEAFERYFENFEIEGIPVSSGVGDEPKNDEIYKGAKNRVDNLISYSKANNIDADYFIGIESGITNLLGKWVIVNIAVIKDKNGYESWGHSPAFPVPDKYVQEIIDTDLGQVMDKIFSEHELAKGKGGIGFLTHDKVTRFDLTRGAFTMALTQFVNGDIWKD